MRWSEAVSGFYLLYSTSQPLQCLLLRGPRRNPLVTYLTTVAYRYSVEPYRYQTETPEHPLLDRAENRKMTTIGLLLLKDFPTRFHLRICKRLRASSPVGE